MAPPLTGDEPGDGGTAGPGPANDPVRELAIQQIRRKRAFLRLAVAFAAASVFLIVIWAVGEYNNAGGWPTDGFSQSSGAPRVEHLDHLPAAWHGLGARHRRVVYVPTPADL